MDVIAIDVGAKGSLAHLTAFDNEIVLLKFLRFDKVGLKGYMDYLLDNPIFATFIIEKVNAMPRQGVTSMFSFGERYGEIRGLLQGLGIVDNNTIEILRPTEWQKIFCKETNTNLDKNKDTKEQIGQVVYEIFGLPWLIKRTGKVNTDFTDSIAMGYGYLKGKLKKEN